MTRDETRSANEAVADEFRRDARYPFAGTPGGETRRRLVAELAAHGPSNATQLASELECGYTTVRYRLQRLQSHQFVATLGCVHEGGREGDSGDGCGAEDGYNRNRDRDVRYRPTDRLESNWGWVRSGLGSTTERRTEAETRTGPETERG